MSNLLGGGNVIYHGAEPALFPCPRREKAKSIFSLPQDKRLALALGFRTTTKGWDILKKMDIPNGWNVVLNSSKSHYNKEKYYTEWMQGKKNIIDLQRGFY